MGGFVVLKDVPLRERLEVLLPRIAELEAASYDVSEAASPQSLRLRATECADWFVVLLDEKSKAVVGFACGTLGLKQGITSPDAMTTHHPSGTRLFLHSVVVASEKRGKGIGLQLVQEFIKAARATPQVESISLIAKAKGVALYRRAGFTFMGDSPLRHGPDRWFAMEYPLAALPVVCVDAFAPRPFEGNSACVVHVPDNHGAQASSSGDQSSSSKRLKHDGDSYLGLLAREFNVAESAFVQFPSLEGAGFGTTLSGLERVIAYAECSACEASVFNETLGLVKQHFQFKSDVKFRVGDVKSEKGQNLGSLCVLAVAKAIGLDRPSTVRMWCEHHRDVLKHAEGTSHPNIRSFLSGGEVEFAIASTGAIIETPIESFDLTGLVLLIKRDSSLLRTDETLRKCALDLVHSHFSTKKDIATFTTLFQLDADHMTSSNKFKDVTSISLPLLAVLARDNIVDVPLNVIEESLKASKTTLEAFCDEFALDSFARSRLNCRSSSLQKPSISASASLRWFTPAMVEVDLCGHATLAASRALFDEIGPFAKRPEFQEIKFSTRSGILVARRRGAFVELDFPAQITKPDDGKDYRPQLARAFPSLDVTQIKCTFWTTTNDLLVVLASLSAFEKGLTTVVLDEIKKIGGRGVCLSAATPGLDSDFVSRFFAPCVGIDEDPVTGSTHCFLATYWGEQLKKQTLIGRQKSSRGGLIECEILEPKDAEKERRILLRGPALVSWRGQVVYTE